MAQFPDTLIIEDIVTDHPLTELMTKKASSRPRKTSPINVAGKNIELLHSGLPPQLKLPEEKIWTLDRIADDSWILNPSQSRSELSPKIPEGKLSFVVSHNDPENILCFEHSAVMEDKHLRERVAGCINYGHSSLANKYDSIVEVFKNRNNFEDTAHPVILAGSLSFPNEDNPLIGGGTMLSWSRESGHYLPSYENAIYNRIGEVEKILPIDLYKEIF